MQVRTKFTRNNVFFWKQGFSWTNILLKFWSKTMSQCRGEVNLNRIVNRKSRWNWDCEKTGCCQWNPWVYYDWCCCMYAAVPIKKGMLFWRMQSKLKSLQLFMFLSPFSPVKLWQLVIPSTWFSQCVTYRPETNFWNRMQKTKLTSQWTIHAQEKSLRVILIISTSKCYVL